MKKIFTLLMLVVAISAQAFEQDKYYTINRNGESSSFIYASGTKMNTGALNAEDGNYIWQLIPTGNADCYYVKNVASDTYVQSCNIELSTEVQLGTDPVEFVIGRGAGTTGSGTTYFLASNDQGGIDYNNDATLGLNKGATGVVAYYIKTGRGNSYWEINEVNYSETGPAPSVPEDDDVCAAIAAYRIPCGTYSAKTRLKKIDIEGEGVLSELHYAPQAAGKYTLYTRDRATLMVGGQVKVAASVVGADISGLEVSVWADFDGDGRFEESVKPTLGEQVEAEFTVPAGTPLGQGRFRIRVDQSGGETANADVYGTLYDLPFTVVAAQEQRTLRVSTNNAERGTVAIEGCEGNTLSVAPGTEVTVVATVKDGYFFHGWKKGRTIVSAKATYTTTMTENKDLVALFATTEGTFEEEEEDDGTYPINFAKNTPTSRTDRQLTAVKVSGKNGADKTLSVVSSRAYNNLTTSDKNLIECDAAEELTVTFTYNGTWMHGYVYIDENNDKLFSFNDGQVDQKGTEVKSFSFYSGSFTNDQSGYNSVGTHLTGNARNVLNGPAFEAPVVAGDYRIRFKVDWNSIDAGGQMAADGTCTGTNGILANGGYIVDATLRVKGATGIEQVKSEKVVPVYNIAGVKVSDSANKQLPKGVYVIGNKKVFVK